MATKVEELRMDIVGCSRAIDPHKTVDQLIVAISQQIENKCKEALAAQNKAWQKECTRQCQSAEAMGRAEGAEKLKQQIRETSVQTDMYTDWHRLSLEDKLKRESVFIVPASVLTPNPKEKP